MQQIAKGLDMPIKMVESIIDSSVDAVRLDVGDMQNMHATKTWQWTKQPVVHTTAIRS
jgi:hypothetical protein